MDFPELTFYLILFKMLSSSMNYMPPDHFLKVVTLYTNES